MENTTKKYGKLLSFTPLACYSLWTAYFFIINNGPAPFTSLEDHIRIVTATIESYTSLFVTLAITCTIHAAILLYFTVHLARIKKMTAGEKIAWMIFLSTFGAFALPVFWYQELRHEPTYIDVYPDIA